MMPTHIRPNYGRMTSAQRPVGQSGALRTTKPYDKENDLLRKITLKDKVKKEAQKMPPDSKQKERAKNISIGPAENLLVW